MADFGSRGSSGGFYERPADRSGQVGRSPVPTPQGGNVTATQGIQHSQGTRNSNKGAH